MATSPSASRRCRASRTLLRLAPVASTISASTSRCPGTSRPRRMRSRSHSTTCEAPFVRLATGVLLMVVLRGRRATVAVRWVMISEMIEHLTDGKQSPAALTLVFSGDLVLDVPDPDHWLAGIAPALLSADLAIGHLEVPHTRRGTEMAGDVP